MPTRAEPPGAGCSPPAPRTDRTAAHRQGTRLQKPGDHQSLEACRKPGLLLRPRGRHLPHPVRSAAHPRQLRHQPGPTLHRVQMPPAAPSPVVALTRRPTLRARRTLSPPLHHHLDFLGLVAHDDLRHLPRGTQAQKRLVMLSDVRHPASIEPLSRLPNPHSRAQPHPLPGGDLLPLDGLDLSPAAACFHTKPRSASAGPRSPPPRSRNRRASPRQSGARLRRRSPP